MTDDMNGNETQNSTADESTMAADAADVGAESLLHNGHAQQGASEQGVHDSADGAGESEDSSNGLAGMDIETAFLVIVTKDGRCAAIHNPDMSSTGKQCRPANIYDIQHACADLVDDLRAVRMAGIVAKQLGQHVASSMNKGPSLRDQLMGAGRGLAGRPGVGPVAPGFGRRPK